MWHSAAAGALRMAAQSAPGAAVCAAAAAAAAQCYGKPLRTVARIEALDWIVEQGNEGMGDRDANP